MFSGEQSKKWIEDNKESLIEVFSELQMHQLKEWIADNKESLIEFDRRFGHQLQRPKFLIELFSEKEGEGEGEGKLMLVCFGINSSPANYKVL